MGDDDGRPTEPHRRRRRGGKMERQNRGDLRYTLYKEMNKGIEKMKKEIG